MAVQRTSRSRKPQAKRARRSGAGKKRPAAKKAARKASRPARKKAAPKSRASGRKPSRDAKAKDRKRAAKKKAVERERAAREKKKALAARDAAKKALAKKREAARRAAEKKRDQERKRGEAERKRLKAEKEREAARKALARKREADQKKKEQERKRKERERERQRAEKAREAARKAEEREKLADQKRKEKEKQRLLKEREAQKIERQKAKEAERVRLKAEKEAQKAREKAEREAERDRIREDARRKKEEERARREAEREAYRKAKEAEQARLRAEREAARRALEGRVVRATRASRAAAGGRLATTTRVYTPSSIPNQSGTRRTGEAEDTTSPFANLRLPKSSPRMDGEIKIIPRTLPPPPPAPPPASVEDRLARINERLKLTDEPFRREYEESFLMSWIYHDSALEGVVYTYEELRMAINPNITVVPDSSLQTVCDEIRRHKAAIEYVKEQAEKKRVPITIDTLRKIYLILHPEEGDLKTVKYRKDIPQHRLYFHEYAAPDKIAYKVRQVFDWLSGPEPKKIKNPIRIAARAHYDLVRIFPFALDSGKAVRLLMNLLLMRADCPPAIVHSTERQRYYEALRGQLPVIVSMVTEAITNALMSIEKKLDERDTKLYTFA